MAKSKYELEAFNYENLQENFPLTTSEDGIIKLIKAIKYANYQPQDHISLLEIEAMAQLQYVKEHLISAMQFELYEKFQEELRSVIQNQQLIYKWWIVFAYRLAILITPESQRTSGRVSDLNITCKFSEYVLNNDCWHSYKSFLQAMEIGDENGRLPQDQIALDAKPLKSLLKDFPDVLLIPTSLGHLSINLFNQCLLYKAMPLGIVSDNIIADGQCFTPNRFFRHDVTHADNYFHYVWVRGSGIQCFVEYTLNKIAQLVDPKQRSQMEFMLFYATHESPNLLDLIEKDNFQKLISRELSIDNFNFHQLCKAESWYYELIKPYIDSDRGVEQQVIAYADECIQLFSKHISNYLNSYDIRSIKETPTKPRNYHIKEKLSDEEINQHWTTSNHFSQEFLKQRYKDSYKASSFFHFLVKKDQAGPESERPAHITVHLRHVEKSFEKKNIRSHYAKLFSPRVTSSLNREPITTEPDANPNRGKSIS